MCLVDSHNQNVRNSDTTMNDQNEEKPSNKELDYAFERVNENRPRHEIAAELQTRFGLPPDDANAYCTLARLQRVNRLAFPMIVEGKTVAEVEAHFAGSGLLDPDELPYLGAALKGFSRGISEIVETTVQDAVRRAVVSVASESGRPARSVGRTIGRVIVSGLAWMLLLASLGGFLEGDSPAAVSLLTVSAGLFFVAFRFLRTTANSSVPA